jgi:probable F420-dependent oxidoreductase
MYMRVVQRVKEDVNEVLPDFDRKHRLGYRHFSSPENKTNPFFAAMLIASRETGVDLSTSIAVAFAKSPMVMALEAYTVNQYSKGKFTLGLGSQIKPHIERRFDMPWSGKPARQMREYIHALNAIWDAFESGEKLDFQGETYRHTLLTYDFVPFKHGFGRPRLMLGAVGPRMTEVAVDLTAGLMTHSFVSEKSLREINLGPIEERLRKVGKKRSEFEIMLPLFIVTGSNEEEYKTNIAYHRHRIGFYASTPDYKSTLELHGWGDVQEEARALTRQGRWDELGEPITDEMLDTFTVMGEPSEIAPKIKARFGDFIDTIRSDLQLQNEETQYEIIRAIESP